MLRVTPWTAATLLDDHHLLASRGEHGRKDAEELGEGDLAEHDGEDTKEEIGEGVLADVDDMLHTCAGGEQAGRLGWEVAHDGELEQ